MSALALVLLCQCTGSEPATPTDEWLPPEERPVPVVDAGTSPSAMAGDAEITALDATASQDNDAELADGGSSDIAGDAAAVASDAAVGNEAGPAADPCAAGPWTCIATEPAVSYGTRNVVVPAAQNWVNTGLFLRKGERATLTVQGSWDVGSDQGDTIDHGPCLVGDMVARSGLHYKDSALTCVKSSATFSASRDGIVFVGALTGNDLGETYESRRNASGQRTLTISSEGSTVPTVQGQTAASYPFASVKSGWVEVWGEHVILTLPVATAVKDASTLAAATKRLDAIYELHEKLRGAVPQQGQRLRFFPDGTQPGYMLAGNPIRMDLDLVTGAAGDRISRAGEPGASNWGFAHEMGHDFTFVGGFWSYQEQTLESWPNLFSLHAFEALGLPPHEQAAKCTSSSTGSYGSDSWDAWTGLCFLLQPRLKYGWTMYEKFFRGINENKDMPWKGDWDKTCWYFVHDRFETASGGDMTALFTKWGVPHP